MLSRITYPLRLALELSPRGKATYTGPEGHLCVDMLERWLITGELTSRGVVREESEEKEWCEAYLTNWRVSLEDGWIPESQQCTEETE